jgi:hypothetical protein
MRGVRVSQRSSLAPSPATTSSSSSASLGSITSPANLARVICCIVAHTSVDATTQRRAQELETAETRCVVGPHYLMALPAYVRITSPLRRSADMLAHLQVPAIFALISVFYFFCKTYWLIFTHVRFFFFFFLCIVLFGRHAELCRSTIVV